MVDEGSDNHSLQTESERVAFKTLDTSILFTDQMNHTLSAIVETLCSLMSESQSN